MNALNRKPVLTMAVALLFTLVSVLVLISGTNLFAISATASTYGSEATHARITAAYGKLPLSFEVNSGQTDARVKFLARGDGYSLFLTSSEAVLSLSTRKRLRQDVVRMRFVGANPSPTIFGLEEQPGRSNYFLGNDPQRWRTDVTHYAKVKYQDVYPGVDIVYYGNQRQLEYDFVVAPGADPSAITFAFEGVQGIEIDAKGDLVLRTMNGEVFQRRPFIYQEIEGARREVFGRYVKKGKRQVGFEVDLYDPRCALVIDPVLVYSTYLGGSGNDFIYGVATDGAENTYVTGFTASPDFPTTTGAFQTIGGGGEVAFVTKLDASGSTLIYSTYLGGAGNLDQAYAIAVDSAGQAYVAGTTNSPDFPTTAGAFDTTADSASDAFVTKLSTSGSSLVYSTCLGAGGSETAYAIAVDGMGQAHLTGFTASGSFPTTPGSFDTIYNGDRDVFATKLNASGSALSYSTYLGGNRSDTGRGIALDESGNAYLIGETLSPGFPTTAGAFDTSLSGGNGNSDAFITKLGPTGSALSYSTLLGGNRVEGGHAIAVDGMGHAYVTGYTTSTDFPVAPGAFDSFFGGNFDVFVTKVSPSGSTLVYSTHLGSGGVDVGYSIAVDAIGHAYVVGSTDSSDFPTTPGALDTTYAGGTDTFVTKLAPIGSALSYSTYLGGSNHETGHSIVVDVAGNVYVAGITKSTDFPTTPGAFDTSYGGGFFDAFTTKLAGIAPTPTPTPTPCSPIVLDPQVAPAGTVGTSYSLVFTPIGGTAPYTFTASGNLPPGLGLLVNGQLTGTPTNVGTFNFTITATDANGCTGARSYELVVNCPVIILAPSALPTGTVDAAYDQLITASGGTLPYTFMTPGGLPPGLNLDTAGRLAGTPSVVGSFTFSVTAADTFVCSGTATYTITINAAPTPTPTPVTNGKIAFETNRDGNSEIYLMDMDGRNPIRLTNNPARDADPFFSPDGSRIVFPSRRDGNSEIYLMNADGTNQTRLTFNAADDLRPAFSPDGSKIAFYRNTEIGSEIYVMNANGGGEVRLTNDSFADEFPKWSPDGTRIIFQSNRDGDYDIYTMKTDGSNVVKLTNNNSIDREASFSPEGSKIVFFSDRTGNTEVWVMNADGSQAINLSNSTPTDGSCSWSADGQKILFISGRDGNTEVYIMNADGTGQTRLTINTALENTPVSQPVR